MRFYESISADYGIQWGIENGWSVPPVCTIAQFQHLDTTKIAISGGDLQLSQLAEEMHKEANLHRLCLVTAEQMHGPTIVFTPSVFSAKGVAHYLTNNYGIPATYIHGKQDEDERTECLGRFRSGDVNVLVNCQVVATGFDHPPTATLILGRPTRSRSFWLQCVGRATRPLPGVIDVPGLTTDQRKERRAASAKPFFKIVDCTGSSLDHKLITAPDMFCDLSEKEIAIAKEIAAREELTPAELEERARAEAEKRATAEAIERMRANTSGRASGVISEQEIDITTGKRSVGTYRNPLKGKFANYKLSDLPGHYLSWGAGNKKLTGWIRNLYRKELERRSR